MYKATHGMRPQHLENNFSLLKHITQREPRSKNQMNMYIPKPFCESFKKSLMYLGPKTWNNLPQEIKEAPSLSVFKKMYKSLYN